MFISCLPPFWYAVEFLKRLGENQPESSERADQNEPIEYSRPATPSLPRTIPPANDDLERTRLLVDTATNRFFTGSPAKPLITTSDYGGCSTNSIVQPSPVSPNYLLPPSPVRSISESSESVNTDDFTSSEASSFSNENVPDRSFLEYTSPLEDQLGRARLDWPEYSTQYFLPADAIDSLITIESIEKEIMWRNIKLQHGQSHFQVATRVLRSAPKLFCVLVILRRAYYIGEFLEENLDDTDLPFVRDNKNRRSGHFRLCSRLHPQKPLKSMSHWTPKEIQDFSREQWSVMTPMFEGGELIKHYEFGDNCVFPFTRDEERRQIKVGGFGSVWEIEIHPAHHSFHSKVLHPSFALKRLHQRSRPFFESEVEMLKLFSNRRRHDHLIRLLATYEFKGEFYLLFPYAKYNLRDYWEQTPDPDFTQFTVKWVLRQCKGIASAIQRIHGYQTTFEAKEAAKSSQSTRDGAELESAGPNGRLYSRHGDIKPENILWSDEDTLEEDPHFNDQGILLIADFGLMRSHKISTEFRVSPEQVKGSIPYEPPEVAEPRVCTTVSRAYDIWSLGCVYLEFVTWIVCSFDELQRFREVRLSGGHNEAFFTILDTGILSGTRKAIVKESVQEWIKGLHNRPRCSDFIHEFLNLIEHHMLIVDPKQRIHCGSLNEKLTDMVRRADEDSNYLLPQDPLLVQRRAIATAVSEHDAQPPSFIKNGTPLPKRPSVANKAYTTEGSRTLNSTQWQLLSEPSSPTSCRYFHGLVGYL